VTGRWPSRDPIEESGGQNLHQFAENNGITKHDYLGQKLDYSVEMGAYAWGRSIGKLKDVGWFGATTTATVPKDGKGENKAVVEPDEENDGKCKVYIKSSQEFNVTVSTFIANDLLDREYTLDGFEAIVDHEWRRANSYILAYDKWLKQFEDMSGKCLKRNLTSLQATGHKTRLEKWLDGKRRENKNTYTNWTEKQRISINEENNRILRKGGLVDSIDTPHVFTEMKEVDMTCPK
jgi:hypothetical protein